VLALNFETDFSALSVTIAVEGLAAYGVIGVYDTYAVENEGTYSHCTLERYFLHCGIICEVD
jgi:hypothetical protein